MMSLIHVFLFLIFGTLASLAMSRTIHETFIVDKHEQWMVDYNRKYESKLEKEKRLNIFKENLEYIESFNNGGNRSFKLSLNEFADMTQDKFIAAHTGYKMQGNPTLSESTSFMYQNVSDVPTSLDWRAQGAVTPVKFQGQCGCCWAFSAVAAIEGIVQIKTGSLISLSEQQLLDCSTDGGNRGCDGGQMVNAFEYVIRNQGLTTEESYPYQETQETCDTEKQINKVATINEYQMVPENDEEALLMVVASQPVSVAIEGHGQDFRFYSGGVFTGDCGNALSHAVTVVGYGTSEEGLNYWLVKNSWGETLGENGYIRIQRDANTPGGLCGIAMKASYPVM
ncbi:ervatamin-B [Gossypium raimondii]|uniref:Peptidase C1A papain C-terminal domain-containing protein n=1 Tax=Gossypium raimondii TaxID=29730 RepID=A0A0D2SEE7_GOSRA|nr:ervatamin-B [Gossypium raimondii]KJB61523.1 hypothetical protein B456_009G363800 [Gossypium raimondii]